MNKDQHLRMRMSAEEKALLEEVRDILDAPSLSAAVIMALRKVKGA